MSNFIAYILLAFVVLVNILLVYLIIIPHILGAPFLRTKKSARQKMFEFADIKPGERIVDLGSGDGVFLFEAARRGAVAVGYEINPFLVTQTKTAAKSLGLSDKIEVYKQNFWQVDLSGFDVVFLFGISHIMSKLEKKLRAELKPGARVISYTFKFPKWQPVKEQDNVSLYIIQDE